MTCWPVGLSVAALALFLFSGCKTASSTTSNGNMPATAMAPPAAAAPAVPAGTVPSSSSAIRIDAGSTTPYTDSAGNVWLPEQGFADGDGVDRGSDVQIANTKDPAIYRTEHYGMTSFSQKVPNGKYTVKLHFAECYEEITTAGQRVFSFTVGGHEFKDFDPFAKAGGAKRAYVETIPVNVTDGKLDITFTEKEQSPEINGIEIIPAP
jgi:hypothetical protein